MQGILSAEVVIAEYPDLRRSASGVGSYGVRTEWGRRMATSAGERSMIGVILVGDASDELPRVMAESLSAAGAAVETVENVYSALVRIGNDAQRGVRMLLVDTRTADRAELGVFEVVQQYFPWVVAFAMRTDVSGASSRASGALTAGEAVARFKAIGATLKTEPPTNGMTTPTQASETTPSEAAPPEMKLHDAVRARMGGESGATPTRRPPARIAPAPQPANLEDDILGGGESAQITPVELAALLHPDAGESNEGAS